MTTANTLEVIAASTALTLAIRKAKSDDGKVSVWEIGVILFAQRKPVRLAWEGIERVQDELLDLDDNELPGLVESVKELFSAWDMSHHAGDVSEEVIKAGVALARAIRNIMNMPPVAELVQ